MKLLPLCAPTPLLCCSLWGIACLSCSKDACSKIDLAFANGRKL